MHLIKSILIILSVIILIIVINFLTNIIIACVTPFKIETVGNVDSWIQFNGNILGGIFGGLIAAFVAYLIAKYKIEKERENNLVVKQLQLRQDISFNIVQKLLDINSILLDCIYHQNSYLEKIINQAEQYSKFGGASSLEDSEEIVLEMYEYIERVFNALADETVKLFNSQLDMQRIWSTYKIVLYEYKMQIETILSHLLKLNVNSQNIKNIIESIKLEVQAWKELNNKHLVLLKGEQIQFRAYSNKLLYDIECLNVDLQNSLNPIFNITLDKPEYEEKIK